jgi:hypothetical protein
VYQLQLVSFLASIAFTPGCLGGGRDRLPVLPPSLTDGGAPVDGASVPRSDAAMNDGGAVGEDGGAPGAARGEACRPTGEDDGCAEDLVCVTDGSVSLCVGLCDGTDYTGCLRTETCNIPLGDTSFACSPSCDLLTSLGCPAGSTCGVFADSTGAVYKGCDSAGTRTQGEDCDSSAKCAPGHVCAYWSEPPYISGWECLQYCDLAGATGPSCPAGTVCSSAPREADPFAEIDALGACR